MTTIPSISVEYARVRLTADVELNSQTVELAFLSSYTAEPSGGDWHAATWLTPAGTTRTAGVLIGPGALVLAEGTWNVWWRLTDTPEVPARKAGRITIS